MAARATRLALWAGLLAAVPFPLAAHAVLSADTNSRGLILTLRSFRTSLRQVAKFAQVMAVVAVFQVQWPALVASVFDTLRMLSLDVASWSGVACLHPEQRQSVVLELLFRWALPLFAVAVTGLAAGLAAACRRLTRRRQSRWLQRLLAMRRWEVLRVLFFLLQLFYASLLKSALLPLTCSPSPNGRLTMNAFPHVVCWSGESERGYWALAAVGLTYSLSLIFAYPLVLHMARRRTDEVLSWWAFAFEDFRPGQRSWALVAVAKDMALNLVPILLPGLGTAQLLATAAVTSTYAVQACRYSPFCDASNTMLEACTSAAVAVLCVFSAGMGFQSEPQLLDLSDHLLGGDRNPIYVQRAVALAAIQGLSLLAPFCILSHQLLVAFERTRRCVPRRLRPFTEEERQAMRSAVSAAVLKGPMLEELDAVEFAAVWSIVSASKAAPQVLARRGGLLEAEAEVEKGGEEWSWSL